MPSPGIVRTYSGCHPRSVERSPLHDQPRYSRKIPKSDIAGFRTPPPDWLCPNIKKPPCYQGTHSTVVTLFMYLDRAVVSLRFQQPVCRYTVVKIVLQSRQSNRKTEGVAMGHEQLRLEQMLKSCPLSFISHERTWNRTQTGSSLPKYQPIQRPEGLGGGNAMQHMLHWSGYP